MDALIEENKRLKKALKDLTIEKNRLEDRMYRAFHKCLNTKKRKISVLQEELNHLQKRSKKDEDATLDEDDFVSISDEENRPRRNINVDRDGESSETDMDEDDSFGNKNDAPIKRDDQNGDKIIQDKPRTGSSSTIKRSVLQNRSKAKPLLVSDSSEGMDSEEDSEGLAFPFPKDFDISKKRKDEESKSSPTTPEKNVGTNVLAINPGENSHSKMPMEEVVEIITSSQETTDDLDDLVNRLCD